MSLGWVVAVIGAVRIGLYYHRFQPENIDRSHSVAYTISGAEVNIAIIASSGPALKAFARKYIPNFLDASRGNTSYSSRGYAHARALKLSGYSRQKATDNFVSQPGRSTDDRYGTGILKTSSYDVDTSSQEAIVPDGSPRMPSEQNEFKFFDLKPIREH